MLYVTIYSQMFLHVFFTKNSSPNSYYYNYNHFTVLWILSGTTQVSLHLKGKSNLDLLEQEIVSGSDISWDICKSAPHPKHNHASIAPLSFLTGWMPFVPPNQQHQSTEGKKHGRRLAIIEIKVII